MIGRDPNVTKIDWLHADIFRNVFLYEIEDIL